MGMIRRIITASALCLALAWPAFGSGDREGESFSRAGIDSIHVRAGSFDVEVHAVDTFEVSVASDLPQPSLFDNRSYRLMHRQSGSLLEVWIESSNLFGFTGSGKIRLNVPRNARIRIETSSGSISLDGLDQGAFNARTASGGISVSDSRGDLDLNAVSGSIDLRSVEGRIHAQSVSGSTIGHGVTPRESSGFSSVSGSIELKFDASLDDYRFDLSTVSGGIVVGKIRAERGLRMGFGGITIRAHTVSGSIDIQ